MWWWFSLASASGGVAWARAFPECTEVRRPPLALQASDHALYGWSTRLVRRPHRVWCVEVTRDGTRRPSVASWSDATDGLRWPTTRHALTATTPGVVASGDERLLRAGRPMIVDLDGARIVHEHSAHVEPARALDGAAGSPWHPARSR